jgi:hypothetical protein
MNTSRRLAREALSKLGVGEQQTLRLASLPDRTDVMGLEMRYLAWLALGLEGVNDKPRREHGRLEET